ncbi:MAG: 1-acyl-sn-glycerol-3-phosphate acyltransferase [Lachnospiraceae bacterium]|nr:1-acyl-sn-glycerol-3-phosphate acyltransferase [Lachnospiraceae bacterium]
MIVIYYFRTFIAAFLALLFLTVFSLIALPVLWLVGKISPLAKEKAARVMGCGGIRMVRFIVGVKADNIGLENIPDEPSLFVANHRSFFDIITVYPDMKKIRLGYIGKKQFKKFLPFKIWMEYMGCIFLDRDNPREGLKVVNQAAEDIKNGKYIWIYPEGTRGHEDGNLPFHAGSFRIAEKAGCAIVPVAQLRGDEAFENHLPYVKPTKMINVFGKPIPTEGLDKAELRELYKTAEAEVARLYEQYK